MPRACVTGSPVSNASNALITSARASISSAIARSVSERWRLGMSAQPDCSNAARAAATAASMSAALPAATVAYAVWLTGSSTSSTAPSTLSTCWPPM